jgi:hypothetical protein
MSDRTKIIMHIRDTDNLQFLARCAKYCIEADLAEGDWKVLSYGDGQLPQPVRISAIKRKSCITVYD